MSHDLSELGRGRLARRLPGAWAVGRPTLHSGPVRLLPVRVTPCFTDIDRLSAFYPYEFVSSLLGIFRKDSCSFM